MMGVGGGGKDGAAATGDAGAAPSGQHGNESEDELLKLMGVGAKDGG